MLWDLGKFRHIYVIIFLLTFIAYMAYMFDVFAFDLPTYSIEEWERVGVIGLIIITIIVPSKYRVIIIGTVLGLTLSYFTYQYLVPFLLSFL
ncbi:DUF5510 family protein [Candidatus Tisiphia endosymbiont of Nemotelus uliginosus]|uniref:DUF5510 family protein n=1 Tax=Candidatus Tisiphia endosymbiont of Nemotelus uliginosus TaxID=3077926 RepID=UPI0035C8D62C